MTDTEETFIQNSSHDFISFDLLFKKFNVKKMLINKMPNTIQNFIIYIKTYTLS